MTFGIILAGGRGERFWPLSRSRRAKQFLPIGGGRSTLLAAAAERIRPLVPDDRLIVITGADQAGLVAESLPTLQASHVIAEPVGRNTAPAVACGALRAMKQDPDAVIIVIPSDAWVGDDDAYRLALETAVRAAAGDVLVTLGVVPSRPETGYGYLDVGDALPGEPEVLRVRRFVEKPDAARAGEYLAGRRHLWNCGIFVMRAAVFLAAVERHLKPLWDSVRALDAAGFDRPEAITDFYASAPSISIDYGVMEPSDNVVTVRAAFPWDDLGSWDALGRVLPKAPDGARIQGDALVLESPDSIVYSDDGLVAILGVPGLIVVRTADATLVLPRERAQEVRQLVQALSRRDDLRKYL